MNGHQYGQHFQKREQANQGTRSNQPAFDLKFGLDRIKSWLTNQIDNDAIDYANNFGNYLKTNGFTTAQIRKIFGEVKMLQQKGWEENATMTALVLLKPKLAYSAKRIDKDCAFKFRDFICAGIDVINSADNKAEAFQNFANLFEAILAYHRAYGGK